ncbi:MAG: hypothetical protein HY814_04055 [Candidatus Riflebacteria bacterium]|nr:hypothetical protein [Candidatus Riflebacteria bacterium]
MVRSMLSLLLIAGAAVAAEQPGAMPLASKIARFAPTEVMADMSKLAPGEKAALDKILQAAKLMDDIYLRQVWSKNVETLARLSAGEAPETADLVRYFRLNVGPWSRIDEGQSFVPGISEKKPAGANFYLEDMTRDEFEKWVATLPEAERKKATGFFHVVRRTPDGKLTLVPYSKEYQEFLEPAARLLREAAGLTGNETLKIYLLKSADSFASNDYFESDIAWMDLDAPIEPTIGPYEVYEDELFGYKAAFEAFVTLRDDAETAKLARFSSQMQELEDHLPIDAKYRNPKLGSGSPIRVVDEVFVAGDANHGVQTAAFNLPNDERVVALKGSKRVMLKNVQQAKFDKVLMPIARVVLDAKSLAAVKFDPFFTHILAHELVHGIGPHNITVDGMPTTVREQLKELGSAVEEAKADITGLWALGHLGKKGVVGPEVLDGMYTTFLASMFRSVRFGITEAHGKGVALLFNWLRDRGAITYDEKGTKFAIVDAKIQDAVAKLSGELMTLEAEGSYQKTKAMLDRYGVVRPEMKHALDKLGAVPVDIAPSFPAVR